MPYIGKKPADIIATAVDTTTGTFSGNVTTGGTLGVTGAVTANAGVVVDNITIDGTTIALSSGTLTLDSASQMILDAAGGNHQLFINGTEYGRFFVSSGDFYVFNPTSDKDILFYGNDGGSNITALKLDMSADGHATFKNGVTLTDGNLVVANGHGIDFSATGNISGTSSELLDDYEEGSFDIAMADGTSHSLTQNASYTKIGRFVHFQAKVVFPDTGTDTTATKLSLPFTVRNRTNYFPSSVVSSNGFANAQIAVGLQNTATFLLQNINGSTGATNQHLTSANLNISLHYET